jgi:hypothetical protein
MVKLISPKARGDSVSVVIQLLTLGHPVTQRLESVVTFITGKQQFKTRRHTMATITLRLATFKVFAQ